MIEELMDGLDSAAAERVRESARYRRVVEQACRIEITRFDHDGAVFESESKDYDFSRPTIEEHIRHGYEQARAILAGEAQVGG